MYSVFKRIMDKMCVVLAVVGNKVDLVDQEKVTIEEASGFAKV